MNTGTLTTAQAIIGAWDLRSFTIEGEDGSVTFPFGEDAQGSIIYTASGRVSAQVMRRGRPIFNDQDQMNGSDDEITTSFKGCISYYGSYEIDEQAGFVAHKVEGSLFPNWQGGVQKRFYVLSENQLTLSSPPTLWGGGKIVAVLVWQRIV